MKVAIHHRKGSFSERWIKYCQDNNIDYKLVNAFSSNIVEQVKDCHCFLWHYHHAHYKDVKAAKNVLFALEHAGIKTFPNYKTAWHFDDKIAQKYLLEAIDAPLVPSYVFYDKKEALNWINETSFPKVFKLKGGAGAKNVKLAKNKKEAIELTKKLFNKGFPQFDKIGNLKERVHKYRHGRDSLIGVSKGIARVFLSSNFSRQQPNERGYEVQNIDLSYIEIAFKVHHKLSSQCTAFDFVLDSNNQPLIVEISYGFDTKPYDLCPGFWDIDLVWNKKSFSPQNWIIENLIQEAT